MDRSCLAKIEREFVMKIVIMGTGKLYDKYKKHIRKNLEIIRFIDNDQSKWGKRLDNILISSPDSLYSMEYDWIFLLSIFYYEMKQQLMRLGIPANKIYSIENHIEKLCEEEPVQYFGHINESSGKKHILIFSHSLISTGAQNVLLTAIHALVKNNYQLAVVSRENGILKDHLRAYNIPVIIIRDIYTKKNVLEELIQWSDIIFINTLLLYYIVLEASKGKKPVFWWIHEFGILPYIDDDIWYSLVMNPYVFTYVVSPLVKRKIEQRYRQTFNIPELQYGIPQLPFQNNSLDSPAKTHNNRKIFAIVGAIGYIKGQDLFLQAVERLPKEIQNNAEFWIVGPGKLSTADNELAMHLSSVRIIGEIPNQDMWMLYSQIDAVICASRVDALPVVIAEACMHKKIVIVSDATGCADYLDDYVTGLLFPNEDVDALSDRIQWVWEHPDQTNEIANAGYSIYQKHFTMEIFEHHLMDSIKKLHS